MTAFLLIASTQALDALATYAAFPHGGVEAWPPMAAVFAFGGVGALLAVKCGVAAAAGAVIARVRPVLAPWIGLVGCVGCLSGLVVIAGGTS